MNDIATILSRSTLHHASEAAAALRSGWRASRFWEAKSSDLAATYRVRLEHLRKLPGPHASRLADSIAECVPTLSSSDITKVGSLHGPAEHGFVIFLSGSGSEVLGCLKVISKLEVTPERWEEVWQGAV
jgi:hypothetical protein